MSLIAQVLLVLVKEIFVGFDGIVICVRDTPHIYTPNDMMKNKRTNQNAYGNFFDALDENIICKKDQLDNYSKQILYVKKIIRMLLGWLFYNNPNIYIYFKR